MAGKKAKSDVDAIRGELAELAEAIYALREQVTVEAAATAASRNGESGRKASFPARSSIPAGLETGTVNGSGSLQIASGGSDPLVVQWALDNVPVESLLDQDFDHLARLLAAIGHRQRLAILKAILVRPRSAAELVTELRLGTTGAAYHHLNVLQSADLVTQADRGVFTVHPQRAAILAIILSSVAAVSEVGQSDQNADEESEEAQTRRKGRKKSGDWAIPG